MTMLLRTLTLAVAVACASAAAAGGGRWRNLRKRRQTAGTGYTMLAGKTIGGTANIMRGVKGWTNAACKKKCDESATGCRFRTVRTCCFSYVFNPKDGYCELWSRGYKSAGASWNIRSGCSSGCMKNSRTGSSLYLKSAAWTPPPSQSPTTPLPTRRPTARAGYCTVKPEKVCKYCGDFCKLNGLCTPIGGQRDSLTRCMISQRQRECCKYVTQAPTQTPTVTPKFCEVLKGKSCEAGRRVSSTRYRTLNTATAGCMGNAKCTGVYAVNCDKYQFYLCGNANVSSTARCAPVPP